MRYVLARKGARTVKPIVAEILAKEEAQGLCDSKTYQQFKENCEASKKKLVDSLKAAKAKGKKVVGYAATSKSTTVLNYCGIGPDLIDYICDTTPLKHNTFTPGTHIPVRPYENFTQEYPETALLFAWNHRDEVMQKEQAFAQAGGQWLTYVPHVVLV